MADGIKINNNISLEEKIKINNNISLKEKSNFEDSDSDSESVNVLKSEEILYNKRNIYKDIQIKNQKYK